MTRAPVVRQPERRRKEWPRDEGEIVGVRRSYDPTQASHRTGPDRRAKVETTMQVTDEMVNRFLSWKLPQSVKPDSCVLDQTYPHRCGTNLLTADEARQMLEHVLAEPKP